MTIAVMNTWRVETRQIPQAILRMGMHRFLLPRLDGLVFWKLLGTGRGETFTLNDADANHWALLTVWDSSPQALDFQNSTIVASWNRISSESGYVLMQPLSSHGEWSGRTPFTPDSKPQSADSPIAVITRARIKPKFWRTFNRSVPPVAADLIGRSDVLVRFGIGEAPIGLQGTFSIWRDAQAIRNFAYDSPAHKQVIADTHSLQWYSEELFARFSIIGAQGSTQGFQLEELLRP